MAPPARPGHGIVLNDAALRRYAVTGKPTDVAPTRS
jgi:hypothetical protein